MRAFFLAARDLLQAVPWWVWPTVAAGWLGGRLFLKKVIVEPVERKVRRDMEW